MRPAPLLPAVLLAVLSGSLSHAAGVMPRAKPNILFAIADDWSYPHASAYGCTWVRTPAFDRVAAGGILFTNTYTPNAKCAPSRSCIVTGRNSWQLKAACNHVSYFPPEFKSYPEALAENGYFTGYTCKGVSPSVAKTADGAERFLTGPAFNKRTAKPPASGISNNDYAANFKDFLDAAPPDKPWCFWYGGVEPHRAYEYGAGAAKGGKNPSDIDRIPHYWPDNDTVRNDLLDYAFEVEHFDTHLGRMLDELERRGLLDNTLVLVTADNGMPFPRAKGNVYEIANHMPLAAMWPRGIAAPGRVVSDYVSFIDFAPTFVQAAGLSWEQTGMAPAAGISLFDIFTSPAAGRVNPARDHVLLGQERHDLGRPNDVGYPIRGIVRDGWLYFRNYEPSRWPVGNPEAGYLNTDGGATKTFILEAHRKDPTDPHWPLCFAKRTDEELYDLSKDPDCLDNLAANPEFRPRKETLVQTLENGLKAQGDPRMSGNGGVFEAEPYAQPGQRDYYNRYMRGEKLSAPWVNPGDYEPAPLDGSPAPVSDSGSK